jgi:hypothetical protein
MARPTIFDLKRTSDRNYWPSVAGPGHNGLRFEAVKDCQLEDRLRIKSAVKASCQAREKRQQKAFLKLALKLDRQVLGRRPLKSLASSRYMRRKRDAIFSQIWRLVDNYPGKVTTATVIKRDWEFTPDQLETVNLGKLLKGFLADLDRRGAGEADGWLIAFMHGEWETPKGVYRLHLHMILAGEMIDVVDRLRHGRNYKYEPDDDVRCRVRIDRKPLSNFPQPLTYCLKAYWPWKHVTVTENGKRRTRRHKRIPEPQHTRVLLFLDRHSLNDLLVLKHVSVKQGRLIHSKSQHGRRK